LSASLLAHLAIAAVVALLLSPPPATIAPAAVPVRLIFVAASTAVDPPPSQPPEPAENPLDAVVTDVAPPAFQPPQHPARAAKPRAKLQNSPSLSPAAADARSAPAPAVAVPVSPPAATRDVVPIVQPAPVYPPTARRQRLEGEVVLRVDVDEDGLPSAVAVQRGSGSVALDEAAMVAVKRWRFAPALSNGRPIVASVAVPVRFRLTD
jgi:protein TonB